MALKKITLQLGSKTISLTVKQFEELKADMRELDRQHHYYWHNTHWYQPWYGRPFSSLDLIGGSASNVSFTTNNLSSSVAGLASTTTTSSTSDTVLLTALNDAKPPEFAGSIISVS